MSSKMDSVLEYSNLSLYKSKKNPILSLWNQNQRRQEVLQRQKEKRESILLQLRSCSIDTNLIEESIDESSNNYSKIVHQHRKAPIGMMLAEWLYLPPEDISKWFIIPCPRGQRCLVVQQSHRTHVYNKYGKSIRQFHSTLPKNTILFCIYDPCCSKYNIIDVIMWNSCDYSIQIECRCRFFMLQSLEGDTRLNEQFIIIPRTTIDEKQDILPAEDGYLFYHPLGFYESGYSPLVCWLQPFMIEEILGIKLSYPVEKPDEYTTAQAYILEEQTNRKEQQPFVRKSHKRRNKKEMNQDDQDIDENHPMSID